MALSAFKQFMKGSLSEQAEEDCTISRKSILFDVPSYFKPDDSLVVLLTERQKASILRGRCWWPVWQRGPCDATVSQYCEIPICKVAASRQDKKVVAIM